MWLTKWQFETGRRRNISELLPGKQVLDRKSARSQGKKAEGRDKQGTAERDKNYDIFFKQQKYCNLKTRRQDAANDVSLLITRFYTKWANSISPPVWIKGLPGYWSPTVHPPIINNSGEQVQERESIETLPKYQKTPLEMPLQDRWWKMGSCKTCKMVMINEKRITFDPFPWSRMAANSIFGQHFME